MVEKSWPELGEELGRKAIDVVSIAASKNANGEVTDRELWLICDAVYDCITGLASWEDANLVYQVRQSLSKAMR